VDRPQLLCKLDVRRGLEVRAGREVGFEMTIDVHRIARVTAVRRRTIVVGDYTGNRPREVGLPGLAIVETRDDESAMKMDNLDWLVTAPSCREYQNHV